MNQKTKAKREFPYVTLILVVTIVLVVAILGYTLVDSIGLIGRMDRAATSQNYKLNENHVDVYRYYAAYSQLYYQYMYYAYGIQTDYTGMASQFSDPTSYALYMIRAMYAGTGAFDETAYGYAKQALAYCEGALDKNLYSTYKDEVASDVADYIDSLQEIADAYGVTLNSFINDYIGKGVSKKDVETAMTYYFVASKYAEKLNEDFSAATTLEEIEKYRDENKSTFYTTEYTSYKLVNNDLKETIDACKNADEVKAAIVNYYVEQKFDSVYKTNITDKKITDEAGKDKTKADVLTTILALNEIGEAEAVFTSDKTSDYEKAAYAICTSINASAKTEVANVKDGSAAYADPTGSSATDLQKWLFGDGRQVDDYTVIKTETTNKDSTTGKETTTTTYTWYVVNEVMVLDTEKTQNAYYVLLSDDKEGTEGALTATQKAEAMMTELAANKTPEKFAELVEKYAAGSTSDLREKLSYDTVKSTNEDLADWLYEKDRAEGDIEKFAVKKDSTDKDKVTGYYVAYYVDENEETWKLTARDYVAAEKVTEWYEEAVITFHVKIDYEFATTAETTAAATEASGASTEPDETEADTAAEADSETEAGTAA